MRAAFWQSCWTRESQKRGLETKGTQNSYRQKQQGLWVTCAHRSHYPGPQPRRTPCSPAFLSLTLLLTFSPQAASELSVLPSGSPYQLGDSLGEQGLSPSARVPPSITCSVESQHMQSSAEWLEMWRAIPYVCSELSHLQAFSGRVNPLQFVLAPFLLLCYIPCRVLPYFFCPYHYVLLDFVSPGKPLFILPELVVINE